MGKIWGPSSGARAPHGTESCLDGYEFLDWEGGEGGG